MSEERKKEVIEDEFDMVGMKKKVDKALGVIYGKQYTSKERRKMYRDDVLSKDFKYKPFPFDYIKPSESGKDVEKRIKDVYEYYLRICILSYLEKQYYIKNKENFLELSLKAGYEEYDLNHEEYRLIKQQTLTIIGGFATLVSVVGAVLTFLQPSIQTLIEGFSARGILYYIITPSLILLIFVPIVCIALRLLKHMINAMAKNRMYHDYISKHIFVLHSFVGIPAIPIIGHNEGLIKPFRRDQSGSTGEDWKGSLKLIQKCLVAFVILIALLLLIPFLIA